ncbi:unnamed protein product [Acanthocheilonema viteae]|uniref:Hexosyltransferase n=1 Tax=Acanthocheilonema viteae TaxID=6277 RepID=A0A498S6E5_ACAVI|nr:unnamed protein product [Acanthocheilonema viteae]
MSKSSPKTEFRIITVSLNPSFETSKNAKFKTNAEAVNTFSCSDNVELYNRYAYKWKIIDRKFCTQNYPDLLLLIVAITAIEQREHRNVIRKTWGDVKLYKDFKTAVLFPLGSTDDLDMMNLIQKEQRKYGDIIQQEFLDTYKNLTLKPVSYKEYPKKYYPQYCSGSFYLLTGDLAGPLFEQARFCTLFWIEDVHVTGHLGMRVQAHYERWNQKILFKWNQLDQLIKAPNILFAFIYTPWEHIQLWKWLKNYYGYDNKYEKINI